MKATERLTCDEARALRVAHLSDEAYVGYVAGYADALADCCQRHRRMVIPVEPVGPGPDGRDERDPSVMRFTLPK